MKQLVEKQKLNVKFYNLNICAKANIFLERDLRNGGLHNWQMTADFRRQPQGQLFFITKNFETHSQLINLSQLFLYVYGKNFNSSLLISENGREV